MSMEQSDIAQAGIIQSPRHTSWLKGAFVLLFNKRSGQNFDLYSEAKFLAGIGYRDQRDKGTPESLWHHVNEVERQVEANYDPTSSIELNRLKALAVLHEILEIKDARGRLLYKPKDLIRMGFPKDFVNSVVLLGKRRGESYFHYVHRLALSGDKAAIMVKFADWEVNSRPRSYDTGPLPETVQFKKDVLYPASVGYMQAVQKGWLVPQLVTPYQYAIKKGFGTAVALKKYWDNKTLGMSRRFFLGTPILILAPGKPRQSGPR